MATILGADQISRPFNVLRQQDRSCNSSHGGSFMKRIGVIQEAGAAPGLPIGSAALRD
jgi:hypothetical protein